MKTIQLSNNKGFVKVDDADYEILKNRKWHKTKVGYASGYDGIKNGRKTYKLMHRLLINPPDNLMVDHKNGDKLDNRRENLRICNKSQNAMNYGKPKNNTSGYRGVTKWKSRSGTLYWVARMYVNNKKLTLGYYREIKDAARAYNNAALKHHGEFAVMNEVI